MNRIESQAGKLLADRRRTLLRLFLSNVQSETDSKTAPDWTDKAYGAENATLLAKLSDRELQELSEIDAALARIREGVYGRCQHCGNAVGRDRLRAVPQTRFCIACSERAAVPT